MSTVIRLAEEEVITWCYLHIAAMNIQDEFRTSKTGKTTAQKLRSISPNTRPLNLHHVMRLIQQGRADSRTQILLESLAWEVWVDITSWVL